MIDEKKIYMIPETDEEKLKLSNLYKDVKKFETILIRRTNLKHYLKFDYLIIGELNNDYRLSVESKLPNDIHINNSTIKVIYRIDNKYLREMIKHFTKYSLLYLYFSLEKQLPIFIVTDKGERGVIAYMTVS
jgi:hypothetical protein